MILINKMKTPFRVAFKVVSKTNKVTLPKFTLNKIDLGDPCVFDNADDNLCTGRGNCKRNGSINNYTCECNPGYKGTDCQLTDSRVEKAGSGAETLSSPHP
jgi:hypothetical protein